MSENPHDAATRIDHLERRLAHVERLLGEAMKAIQDMSGGRRVVSEDGEIKHWEA